MIFFKCYCDNRELHVLAHSFPAPRSADLTKSNGLLVPQVAVSRDEKGNPTVLIVGPENKVEMRKITAPRTIGTSWLVTSGLKPGEKIIVDGAQMLRPGIAVKAVPAQQGSDQSGQRPAQRGQ